MLFGGSIVLMFIVAGIAGKSTKNNRVLNCLLLILMLINVYFIGVFLKENLPIFFTIIIDYLRTMTSSLDAVILVALITSTITLLNSFYSRYSDNKNKRKEYLNTKREGPYSDFIELINKVTQQGKSGFNYSDEDMLKDVSSFNSKLILWGSPNVVKKWNDFRKQSSENSVEGNTKDTLILIEDVMNEMRKDLGVKKVKKGNILSIFINDIETVIGKTK